MHAAKRYGCAIYVAFTRENQRIFQKIHYVGNLDTLRMWELLEPSLVYLT